MNILRCKLDCTFPSSQRGSNQKNFADITHYHCFGCTQGFKRRNEAIQHIKSTHNVQLSTLSSKEPPKWHQKQKQQPQLQQQQQPQQPQQQPSLEQQQPGQQQQSIQQQQILQPLNQQLQQQLWQQQSPQPLHEQQQLELLQVDQSVQQPQQQQQNQQYQMHQQFQYKPVESRSIRQQPARVKCPYPDCGREFHPNSLSTHIKTKHAELGRKGISATRYLHGACVDSINGIYMVQKQLRGTDHPIHCQFKTSHPSSIVCSVETCRQHSDTATQSGQAYFLCDHVKSTHFIGSSITAAPLKEESLDRIIDALKWLKPERKMECLEWKKQASLQNVP